MQIKFCLQDAFKRTAFVVLIAWTVVFSSSAFGLPEALNSLCSQAATLQENFVVLESALEQADGGSSRYITGALLRELLRRTNEDLD